MDGWPDDVCRVAAGYADGIQLDLVLMPADGRPGLPDRSISIVDKDQRLAVVITPPVRSPPSIEVAREWVVLGWWAIATADKYVRRSSLFEAVHAIDEARTHALRLWAAGRGVPYAAFGLTSLLDFPPFELPHDLMATTPCPAAWTWWPPPTGLPQTFSRPLLPRQVQRLAPTFHRRSLQQSEAASPDPPVAWTQ